MNNNETFMITDSYLDEEYKAEYDYHNDVYDTTFLEEINSLVDGYMIKPIALYEGIPIQAKTRLIKNLKEAEIEFTKEKELGKEIFFYKLAFNQATNDYQLRYGTV